MGIQDDMFDVADALKRNIAALTAFQRLEYHFNNLEAENQKNDRLLKGISDGLKALKELAK